MLALFKLNLLIIFQFGPWTTQALESLQPETKDLYKKTRTHLNRDNLNVAKFQKGM